MKLCRIKVIKYYLTVLILILSGNTYIHATLYAILKTTVQKSGVEYYSNKQDVGIIEGTNVRIRKKPSIIDSDIIDHTNKGDVVEIIDRTAGKDTVNSTENYWYKVKLENRNEGWVFGQFLRIQQLSENITIQEQLIPQTTHDVTLNTINGLKLIMQANKNVFETDEPIDINLTITNMNKEIYLNKNISHGLCCITLILYPGKKCFYPWVSRDKYVWRIEDFIKLNTNTSHIINLTSNIFQPIKIGEPGEYQLVGGYTNEKSSYQQINNNGILETVNLNIWKGKIYSNIIPIKVIKKKK